MFTRIAAPQHPKRRLSLIYLQEGWSLKILTLTGVFVEALIQETEIEKKPDSNVFSMRILIHSSADFF
jgi:hypothetical protein